MVHKNKIQLFISSFFLLFTATIVLLGRPGDLPIVQKVLAQVPSQVCLGTCPSSSPTAALAQQEAAAASVTPTTTVTPTTRPTSPQNTTPSPTTAQNTTPTPTTNPCHQVNFNSTDSTNTTDIEHRRGRRKWGRGGKSGGVSQGIIQMLLQLLQQLLQLIQQFFGGGGGGGGGGVTITTAPTSAPCPSSTPGISPTSGSATSTVSPTTGSTSPTITPTPGSTTPTITPTPGSTTPSVTPTGGSVTQGPTSATQPIAVVFRGPATSCCATAMANMLQADTKQNFKIIYAGGNGDPNVETALATPGVKLYAQPGGDGDSYTTAYQQGFANDPGAKAAIQNFVNSGGRYIGICMGAWFTASDAFDIIPGSVEDWPTTSGAEITDATADVIVHINWRGTQRQMFYEGGPDMVLNSGVSNTVLGTYNNGKVATVVYTYGSGKIGLSGPHEEAPADWYTANNLSYSGSTQDLANDFIDTLMQ